MYKRQTIEGIKGEIVAGKSWDDLIDSAERFIRRHGGTPAFPVTISVNDIAAHYTTNSILTKPEGLEEEMVFEKGDLVKLDVGVHIKGALADNALTVEVGGGGDHTDQIRAAKEARDAQIEAMTPGSTWAEIGAVADQVHTDAGFQPVTNLCGHKWKSGTCTLAFQSLLMIAEKQINHSKEALKSEHFTPLSHSTLPESLGKLKIYNPPRRQTYTG